jgi:peptide/nickel transport system permease protein
MTNSALNYVARRLLRFVFLMWVVVTITFFLFRVMPGDPTAMLITGAFTEEARQSMLQNFGLTRPLHEQYVIYIGNLLQGELGRSFFYKEPVLNVIIPKMINTLVIMVPAFVIVMANAYFVGTYLGWNKGSLADRVGTYVPLSFRALPHFVLGLFLLMIFSYELGWLPAGGMGPIGGGEKTITEQLTSLTFYNYAALPFATALLHYISDPLLLMRGNVISEKYEDYIELHELKGLSQRAIRDHAARNSLLPLLTWLTPMVSVAFGGQILIETVFSWPGIGRALVSASTRQDFPVAQAAFLIISAAVLFTNLLVDLAYGYFDPRISYGEA